MDIFFQHLESEPQRVDFLFAQQIRKREIQLLAGHVFDLLRHIRVDLHLRGKTAVIGGFAAFAEFGGMLLVPAEQAEGEVVVNGLDADLSALVGNSKVARVTVCMGGKGVEKKQLVQLLLIIRIGHVQFLAPGLKTKLIPMEMRRGRALRREPAPVHTETVLKSGDV